MGIHKNHLFIFPGLVNYTSVIKFITGNWERKFGITVHIVPIDWHDNSTNFHQKLTSLTDQIKPYAKGKNNIISLLGISAGASAAINIWKSMDLEVKSTILVCGRIKKGKPTGGRTLNWTSRNSQSFKESVLESEKNLKKLSPKDRTKILIFYSIFDELVPPISAVIDGTKNICMISPEHIVSIGLALTIYTQTITSHIKTGGAKYNI